MVQVKVKENKILCYNNKTYYPDTIISVAEDEALKLVETDNVVFVEDDKTDNTFFEGE